MGRFKYLILFIVLGIVFPGATENLKSSRLPYRAQLSGEIKFWKKVFSEISLNQYLIHDSENLSILYKIVTFDSSVSERNRQKELKAVKEEIKNLLLKFHKSKPEISRLNSWELQVYQQFQHSDDPQKFLLAARRIRAQQGIRENFLAGVQRSHAYLPHLERVFREEGLPRELTYLPHVESSFNPVAVSHVGAAGMWQFMRRTARLYMKVNRVMDERFDPFVSTSAAARLLKYNYNILKDWALAITAYNHGLGSMKKAKRRFGRDYMKIREKYLRRSFGFASKNFYPEFLAVVEMMDSLEYYFPEVKKNPPLVFKEIKLPGETKLNRLAEQFSLSLDTLKAFNPGYRSQVWEGLRSVPAGYALRLPIRVDVHQILVALGSVPEEVPAATVMSKTAVPEQLAIVYQNQYLVASAELEISLRGKRPGVETDISKTSAANDREMRLAMEGDFEKTVTASPGPFLASNFVDGSEFPAVAFPKSGVESRPVEESRAAVILPEQPLLSLPAAAPALLRFAPESRPIALTKPTVDTRLSQAATFQEVAFPAAVSSGEEIDPAGLAVSAGYSFEHHGSEIHFRKPGVKEALSAGVVFSAPQLSPSGSLITLETGEPSHSPGKVEFQEDRLVAAVIFLKPGVENPVAPLPALTDDLLESPQDENPPPRFAMTSSVEFRKPQLDNSDDFDYQDLDQWVSTATENQKFSFLEILPIVTERLTVSNEMVVVYPEETLGHFSDWLNISLTRLRRINQVSRRQKIYTGQRLRLDFSRVSPAEFYKKRLNYHLNIITELLSGSSGIKLVDYAVNPGENIWYLAHKKYKFPVNLLLYFNDLDKLEHLYPGDIIKLPIIYN